MLRGKPLCPVEHFRAVIIRARQPPSVNIRPVNPDCRRFLRLGDLSPETLQADCIRDFDSVNVRENQRITRCFNDGDGFGGILLKNITFHEYPGVNIDTQVFPLS